MLPVTIMPPIEKSVSRREFARRAAFGAASAALIPLPNLVVTSVSPELQPTAEDPAQNPNAAPNLSPQGQAEADSRYHAILQEYGGRFSDAQKADLKRLCFAIQPPLDRIRAYTINNSDFPAVFLKPLVERESKGATSSSPVVFKKSPAPAKL